MKSNTVFSVSHGTTSYRVTLGDYYSAAVGKFELMGRFDPNGLNAGARGNNTGTYKYAYVLEPSFRLQCLP